MSDETIELWTLQDIGAIERLKRDGVLRCDGRKMVNKDFRRAYKWLVQQMKVRVPGYHGRYPMWAWPYKPDMRTHRHRIYGEAVVRIGFRIPRSRILLHDFTAWHSVLNRMAVTLSEAEWDASDNWTCEEIEKSWERIFDLDLLLTSDPAWVGEVVLDPQVTFDEIRADEVFSTRIYQPRPLPKWLKG